METEPAPDPAPATLTHDVSGVASAAICSAFVVEVTVTGKTRDDAWERLVALVCFACESKQRNGAKWPFAVETADGRISVSPNTKASRDEGGAKS